MESNPVFNDQLAGQLIGNGNYAIAVGLVLLQIAIIPLASFIVKKINESHKKIIDLETSNRKMERDLQIKDLDNRISHLEKDNNQKIDEVCKNMDRINNTMTRLFEKFDKMTEKMEELVIRIVKVEKL